MASYHHFKLYTGVLEVVNSASIFYGGYQMIEIKLKKSLP